MDLMDWCKGRKIAKIGYESRGSYEGCFVFIEFEDGDRIQFVEGPSAVDRFGDVIPLDD